MLKYCREGETMLGRAMNITIETLAKQGYNKSQIAKITGHDWKTVSKTIRSLEAGDYPSKKPHPKMLDKYREEILEYLENNLSGIRIFEKLRAKGVSVGYSTVKLYISGIKHNDAICVRFHTAPGEESQVDFGYAGLTPDNNGRKRKTWFFNMRLSYSRCDYYEKVYDQKVETFIQCHINAFEYYGGIPRFVKIDNLKAAILEANFYEPIYQNLYKQFADYYKFSPVPCRVRKPQEKGKTESGIKYIKNNFFAGRHFKNGDDLDKRLRSWLDNKCNKRIHGTTRKVPIEVFRSEEADTLIALPEKEFEFPQTAKRKVYFDCHIYFNYNYYSVPYDYVGKDVEVRADKKLLKIFYNDKLAAVHPVSNAKGEFITNTSHYPPYKYILSTEYQESYQAKMKKLGLNAEKLFFNLLKNKPYCWNRTVKGILSLRKEYSNEVIEESCKRALAFNIDKYSTIRNICKSGAYRLPLATEGYYYGQR
jgi:transposase